LAIVYCRNRNKWIDSSYRKYFLLAKIFHRKRKGRAGPCDVKSKFTNYTIPTVLHSVKEQIIKRITGITKANDQKKEKEKKDKSR